MKIGYVIKNFHPVKGGAETHILNLALNAKRDGNEVFVFTSDAGGSLREKQEIFEGIKIIRSHSWFDKTAYLAFYPSMLKNIMSQELDVIHSSGFGFIWHDFILLLKKFRSPKTKFINTPHGPFMALSNYSFLKRIVRAVLLFVQKIYLDYLFDAVIEVNTFQWQWISSYGFAKNKVHFVPNGLPESIIDMKIESQGLQNFKRKYNIKDGIVITTLSRISKYKGIQDVLAVIPELSKQFTFTYIVM